MKNDKSGPGRLKTADHFKKYSWQPGRRYLTVFLALGGKQSLVGSAKAVWPGLTGASVAICPAEFLHQTVQGAGWEDELSDGQILAVREQAVHAAAGLSPFELSIKSLQYEKDAIFFILKPPEPLVELRRAMHRAVTQALGKSAPGSPEDIYPHMTVGYCNAEGDAAPLITAVERFHIDGIKPAVIDRAELVWLSRGPAGYRWDLLELLPFKA